MAETRTKEFTFPLAVEWLGGRKVAVQVAGKSPLAVTPPPEFRGTEPSVWSPEDLLVGAAASCFAVTFTGLAERAGLTLRRLEVDAAGTAGKRDDGRFGFTRIDLRVEIETAPGEEAAARELAQQAEERCLVSASLALPVHATVSVGAAVAA
jgi:peroxiredoxin-like protein